MEYISNIDPMRQTIGAIYREAQINGERGVIIGDASHEIQKGLIEDINIAIKEGVIALEGKPFYLCIYEKKDLSFKYGDVRIPKITTYRPYPEQDTIVYHVIPEAEEVYFCWELPHRSQMINMLNNPDLFDHAILDQLRRWENLQLEYFGFMKDEEGMWKENIFFRGDVLQGKKGEQTSVSMGMSSASKVIPLFTS